MPVILAAIECPTHAIVDAALRTLPSVLPVLDFSTIKNELFPVVAAVFSRTNSLAIKVRGLQAFVILCGGSADAAADDGLNGLVEDKRKTSSSSALDKYTMQEKIVPLIRSIKTKEPAVMIAALNVLRIVGQTADAEFVAMDILPVLWSMSLGPLLDLKQFQTFMELIKNLSRRVEEEQSKKLQETSGNSNGAAAGPNEDFLAFGGVTGTAFDASGGGNEDDFESLVKGRPGAGSASASNGTGVASWDETPSVMSPPQPTTSTPQTPSFSWSTQTPASPTGVATQPSQGSGFRTVTPDLARFGSMTPSSTQFSQPLQPTQPSQSGFQAPPTQPSATSFNWSSSTASAATANPWASTSSTPNYAPNYSSANPTSPSSTLSGLGGMTSSMSGMSLGAQRPSISGQRSSSSSFSLPPPPGGSAGAGSFGIKPPPNPAQQQTGWSSVGGMGQMANKPMGSMGSMGSMGGANNTIGAQQQQQQQQKSGLDKYESLI